LNLREVHCRSILTRTGGFLQGFTHTLNPYRGCTFGRSLCGVACYAPEVLFGPRQPWGSFLDAKVNAHEVYPTDLRRESRRGPVRVFCASVTDPYVPQERRLRVTQRILQAVAADPPEFFVLQTHTPGPLRDLDLLERFRDRVAVHISVETDRDSIPGLPPHAYSPARRLDALRRIKAAGLRAVGVVAPLLPLRDTEAFARALDQSCTSVIVDHYLVGDGSRDGARTKRRGLPARLVEAGFEAWTRLESLHETVAVFRRVLGDERVGVSKDGFNRSVE